MIPQFFLSVLFILWLAGRASADGGDDFANNLASDLGPILALFGERVVMQFMSQAMGIADCILLAVAPIGAITTVVSAIRVAGPAWLKSFVGRARENLSAAEIEVMSSTSEETCELWNGHSVVRCPGSADIYQFICLIPKCDISTLAQKGFNIRYKALKDIERDIEKPTEGDRGDNIRDTEQYTWSIQAPPKEAPEKSNLLLKKKRTGPMYTWQCFRSSIGQFSDKIGQFSDKLRQVSTSWMKVDCPDPERQGGTDTITENSESLSSKMPSSSNLFSKDNSKNGEKIEVVIIADSIDNGAPNLLLNCHDRVGRSEIYLAAAFGVILQLGAVVYFGVATYHKPIQSKLLKDGKAVVKYAFPCAAIGTLLLVLGLFICSWVVGESTKETYYEAENHQIYVVWIQKNHTVSDQVFKPYAIYPTSKREYITISRRNINHRPQEIRSLLAIIWRWLSRNPIVNIFQIKFDRASKDLDTKSSEQIRAEQVGAGSMDSKHSKTAENMNDANDANDTNGQPLYWPMKFMTVLGTLISLLGFISQFIGMRGLNWTASVVQLGITILVTILRAIVRRGLGKPPAYTSLDPKFELDWFVLSFGNLAKAPWANFNDKLGNLGGQNDNLKYEGSPKWEIRTGGRQACLPLRSLKAEKDQPNKDSKPHEIMLVRKLLGELSKWNSPVLEEAIRLSKAIEVVAQTFLSEQPEIGYEWVIPATYTENNLIGPVNDNIYITIYKDKDDRWRVDEAEIEAILSLWLYSTSPADISKTNTSRNLRFYGSNESEKRLLRDFQWWIPESIPKISSFTGDEFAEFAKTYSGTAVGFTAEHDDAKYIFLECQDKKQRLFSRDLLFSFVRAVAKMSEVSTANASSRDPLNYSEMAKRWREIKFTNDVISELVRKLDKIEFGTLSDIYIDLVIPLSLEQKLTNVKNIINNATSQAQDYERSHQWKKLVDTCLCLLDLAREFDLEKEPSGPLAIAVCLGFLYRLRHEDTLQKSERRREEELTTQLQQLEKEFSNERLKNSTYFSAFLPGELKHFAVSLSILAGPNYNSATIFPDSFQIADEHLKVMQDSELGQILHIQDFKTFEKTDTFGWSPLHYAANLVLHRIVIDDDYQKESDIFNLPDLMGWTPLQHACLCGNEKFVKMLLEHETPIEIAGKDGITPMHCAVQSGNTEIVQELIKWIEISPRNQVTNAIAYVDNNERYPIHWAAVEGNLDMVRLLRDDIGLTDRFGWTPLHLAAIYGHKPLLQYITKDLTAVVNIDAGDNMSHTPLHLAVRHESIAAVQILVDAGAHVSTAAWNGSTPLHAAIKHKQILKKLLKYGADKEAMDIEGRTPLFLAVEYGMLDIITLLIADGANANTAAKDGRTPLHVASGCGKDGLGVAKVLLQAGADANTKAQDGATVLHIAAQSGSLFGIINMLTGMDVGLDIDATDRYGQTPLLIAIYGADWKAAKLLLDMKASINADQRYGYTPLLGAVIGANEDILQQLLEMGADAKDADEDGYSALHLAVLDGKRTIIRILLDADADIDAIDALRNETPLHIAVRKGYSEIVQTLLDSGATTISLNSRGFSPLQHALYRGDLPMVQRLVEHDKTAAIKAALQKNEKGDTPLHTLATCEKDEDAKCKMLDELLSISPKVEINAENSEGNTPLDSALSEASAHRLFITKMLEKGAKPGSEGTRKVLEDWKSKD